VLEHLSDELFGKVTNELARVARNSIVIGVPYRQDLRQGMTRCAECGCVYHVDLHCRSFNGPEDVAAVGLHALPRLRLGRNQDVPRRAAQTPPPPALRRPRLADGEGKNGKLDDRGPRDRDLNRAGIMKRVLMISPYYPPCGGPGVQRFLKFSKYLPSYGWQPTILTADTPLTGRDDSLCEEIPPGIRILRTPAVTSRDVGEAVGRLARWIGRLAAPLGVSGERIFEGVSWRVGNLVVPDNAVPWVIRSIRTALRTTRDERFDAVLTTGGPHSTHLVGLIVNSLRHVPWVADFRDPWTTFHLFGPHYGIRYRTACVLEPMILDRAQAVVTVGHQWARDLRYVGRTRPRPNVFVIHNGFDWPDVAPAAGEMQKPDLTKFRLHHNGRLNHLRSAVPFLQALARFLEVFPEARHTTEVTFTSLPNREQQEVKGLRLATVVKNVRELSHKASISTCRRSSALLLITSDAPGSEGVITGKVYEYLALGRPILALIRTGGELEGMLRRFKGSVIAPRSNINAITSGIESLYRRWRRKPDTSMALPGWIDRYSREYECGQLAALLSRIQGRDGRIRTTSAARVLEDEGRDMASEEPRMET